LTSLHYQPIFGSYLLVVVVAAVLTALLLMGPAFRAIARRQRIVLTLLRAGVIVLLLVAMLRPTWYGTTTKPLTATLIVLLDQSRSMQVPDAPDGKTRWEAQVAALRDALPVLEDLAENLEVKFYVFDSQARQLQLLKGNDDFPPKPTGRLTDIGSSLSDAVRRELGKRLAGVILLSDGAQRAYAPRVELHQAVRELIPLQCPLHTVAFGLPRDKAQARDVAMENLQDEYRVFVKNELFVRGSLRVQGYVNQGIPVEMVIEDSSGREEAVDTALMRASEDGQQLNVEMKYTPVRQGQYKLTLRAAPQPGELVTKNNQLSAFLTVLKGGLKVLYLEGELRLEQKFLRRSIDSSADIQLDYLWIDHRRRDRKVDLTDQLEQDYDVFIIGDLDSTALGEKNLRVLRENVDQGKGLIMIGGYHSFGPGGYGKTDLADVLPILFNRFERQDFDAPILAALHVEGPLQMLPAEDHYLMHLAPGEANRAAWERLKPLTGANKFARLKGNALLLAETPDGVPLLVAGEPGGRVLAFAGDSTWQWWMQSRQAQTDHRRFWRQVILWLAGKEGLEKDDVWVKLSQRRFNPGDRVAFTAGARSPSGDAVTDAVLTAKVTQPDGQVKAVQLSFGENEHSGMFEATEAIGDYMIEVTATRNDVPIGSARTKFLVFDRDLELSDPSARPKQLAALADMTEQLGGKAWAPEQLPALLRQIKEKPPEMEIEIQTKWQLGDTWKDAWLFLLLLVGLLTVEWFLRKKWGFV